MSVVLEPTTVERLGAEVTATDELPTDTPPDWAFLAPGAIPAPTDWDPGSWDGTKAITPTIGGTTTSATVKLAAGKWVPWVRITVPGGQPVRRLRAFTMRPTPAP